jgi:hypothetical protein
MTQELYDRLVIENGAVDMIRLNCKHSTDPYPKDCTVLICAGSGSRGITQLTLESLLRFYPDISVLVVNGSPDEFDLTTYLEFMSLVYPNVRVWNRGGLNSHGDMMNDAIKEKITDEYILLLDNDSITIRGGYIEPMIEQLQEGYTLGTGALMLVTRSNEACGAPKDESDILRYIHPSCGLIRRSIYIQLEPFKNHGAPCVFTMLDAERKGIKVKAYPIDKHTCHLSGANWCNTIWMNDHDIWTRPFMSFIVSNERQAKELEKQCDHDFDVHFLSNKSNALIIMHDGNMTKQKIQNRIYDLRFRVKGYYVCYLPETVTQIDRGFVKACREQAVHENKLDQLLVWGVRLVERKKWQYEDCLLSQV